jgi:hypothetical protein
MEPDFIQSGDMTFTVNGSGYARGANVSTSFPFTDTQEKVDVREERRLMTLKFESNVVGGDYQMGRVLLDIRTGDVRP